MIASLHPTSALQPSLGDQTWFIWGLVLVVAFPIAVIVLGEIVHVLRRRQSPAAAPLSLVRNLLLPGVVTLLFARFVLERSGSGVDVQLGTTIVWILGLGIALSLITAILFRSTDSSTWRGRVPRLFVDVVRIVLVAIGIAIIVGTVWGVNLGGLFAALGVGGIVFGFALQDTLSSFMAGLALVSDRPFGVGDWVVVGDVEGSVIDINWRTVRIMNRDGDLVVIPNAVFGQQSVQNNSRPSQDHVERIPLRFSLDDPPSKVHRVLVDVAMSTPGVLAEPLPQVHTISYAESWIEYSALLSVTNSVEMPGIRSDFMSRVWYAARRHELTIPVPTQSIVHREVSDDKQSVRTRDLLRRRRLVAEHSKGDIDFAPLADDAEIRDFGAGEVLIRQGERSEGMGLVVSGRAIGSVRDANGEEVEVLTVATGEVFGELAAFAAEPNRMTVRAETDMVVVAMERAAVQAQVRRSGSFADEVERIVQARRAVIERRSTVAAGPDRTGSDE